MPIRSSSLRLCLATAALAGIGLAPLVVRADTPPPDNTYTAYKVDLKQGEPSIGYDPTANAALYGADTHTERLTWDAAGTMTQTLVDAPTAATSLDAITFVDPVTHRTFNSQLAGGCSLLSFSDDAGANWTPSTGCGINTLLDHQSVGGGPYHAPLDVVANPLYPHAVYYCAQNGFNATCARSDNGGVTFGPGAAISNQPGNNGADPLGGSCSGLHGHLRVSPDGTVYVPLKGCGGTPSVNNLTNEEYVGGHPTLSVSQDNGITYTLRMVNAGNNSDESDPSVATTPDNTVYFGWQDGVNPDDSHNGPTSAARIAVSRDHGQTWTTPVDLSSPLGLHNVQFPEVIAGDNGRAAMAFLGTAGVGDDQTNAFTDAVWHMYVSTTYNGGLTWHTVDATPNDPVQRGCIDLQGIAPGTPRQDICKKRNLLDFNDITVDGQGRVLVAYADGCIDACVTDPSKASTAKQDMVLRQTGGRGLLTAYDSVLAGSNSVPPVSPSTQPAASATSAPAAVSTLPNTSSGGTSGGWLALLTLPAGVVVARALRRRRAAGREATLRPD